MSMADTWQSDVRLRPGISDEQFFAVIGIETTARPIQMAEIGHTLAKIIEALLHTTSARGHVDKAAVMALECDCHDRGRPVPVLGHDQIGLSGPG